MCELADAGALYGGEDGELDALLGHEVEDAAVDGGFGEPHAFGFAAVAELEVGDAPADLGEGVALVCEGHGGGVVDRGHVATRSPFTLAPYLVRLQLLSF